jgi:hypothetical protein
MAMELKIDPLRINSNEQITGVLFEIGRLILES